MPVAGTTLLCLASLLLTGLQSCAKGLHSDESNIVEASTAVVGSGGGAVFAHRSLLQAPSLSLPTGRPYSWGSPSGLKHLWVDPRAGSDLASGSSRSAALRTLAAAWRKIPQGRALARGYHIHVLRGTLTEAASEFTARAFAAGCRAQGVLSSGPTLLEEPASGPLVCPQRALLKHPFPPLHCAALKFQTTGSRGGAAEQPRSSLPRSRVQAASTSPPR